MLFEIAPAPPITPATGATDKLQGQDGSISNPFASLLASLDAVQQPQVSAITKIDVQNISKALVITSPKTGEFTPENSVAAIDALKAIMGPAFNSRLSLAPTQDVAKSVAVATPLNNTLPIPAEAALSLLNLLESKSQASAVQILPAAITPAHVAETLATTEMPDELNEQDTEDEPTEAVTPVVANIMVATAIEAAPPEQNTDTALIGSDTRVSLFDKLSSSVGESAETTTQGKTEAAAVEAPATETATPSNNSAISAPPQKPPEVVQAAQLQPTSQNDSPPTPLNLPHVTMRPVNEAQMVQGVSVLLARAGKNQVSEFVIRMDPPELGRIEVQMKMSEDGTVQAVIASDNPNTHDLLRREASTIERALNESGFRTGNDGLSFNLKQHNSEQQRRDPEKYPPGSNNGGVAADDTIPSSVFAPLRQRYENARVNISA
jgi:flagellar hook-length control protein FliK